MGEREELLADTFNGDNQKLVGCIEALIKLDADGALVPHGLGGSNSHAVRLLAAAAARLRVHAQSAPEPLPAEWEDPQVQQVYRILCDQTEPPGDDHWEGFAARRIVAALRAPEAADAGAVAYRWRKPGTKPWLYQTAPARVSYEGMEFEYLYASPTAAGIAAPPLQHGDTLMGERMHYLAKLHCGDDGLRFLRKLWEAGFRLTDELATPPAASADAVRNELKRLSIEAPQQYLAAHKAAPGGAAFADEMYAQGIAQGLTMALAALSAPVAGADAWMPKYDAVIEQAEGMMDEARAAHPSTDLKFGDQQS